MKELLNVDIQTILKAKPRELKAMAFSDNQVKGLVRTFYRLQDMRTKTANQQSAFRADERPDALVTFFSNEMLHLEKMVGHVLDGYSAKSPLGQWARSISGIGPIISAGLLANINITKAPVVSHIWRYAGLDPTVEWLGKEKAEKIYEEMVPGSKIATVEQLAEIALRLNRNSELFIEAMSKNIYHDTEKGEYIEKPVTRTSQINAMAMRPWNDDLKVLCWKIGESFVRVSNNPKDTYGKIYQIRKAYEQQKNQAGDYKEQAEAGAKRVAKSTLAYKSYSIGLLPDGHINSRAKRYAVKIFLSHYHAVAYELHYNEKPPKPFAIAILNHAHEIPVPNWPMN